MLVDMYHSFRKTRCFNSESYTEESDNREQRSGGACRYLPTATRINGGT